MGDTVGGLRVVRMEGAYLDEDRTLFSGIIEFSGEVTLSGTYIHYPPEEEFVGGQVCFDQLDEASLARLPRARGDERYLWFCFTNREEARQALAPAGVGEATVVIDGYTINLQHTETWNTARLVRVEAVRNPRPWTKPVKVYPEGTEETRTFRLVYLPILPFTTYVPADWQHEPMQNEEEGTVGIRLIAPNDIGFVDVVFFPPGTDRERVDRAVAERLATYPWRQPTDSDGTEFRAADRTASDPGQWKAAELQLGQRGDRYYYLLIHLGRLEAGDGWGPVVEAILDEWRWRDTGEPLRPSP
ncbi:MAG: hypothetical protein L6E13_09275 [Firmicutes bacterium]|nr:hypothetical protein [Bacillota bacterium]